MDNSGPMSTGWYVHKQVGPNDGPAGPYTWDDLYLSARAGAVQPGDLVWHAQMPDWLPASQIPGLMPPPTAATPHPAPARPAYAPPAPQPHPAPAQPNHVPPAYAPLQQTASAPRRRSRLLPILIPLVTLLIVGGGLGAYFGFFYHRGESGVASGTGLGAIEFQLPAQTTLVKTAGYGLVPADQICVMLADGQDRGDAKKLAKALDGTVVGELEFLNAYQIQTGGTTEADLAKALETAHATQGVLFAFPNQTTAPAAGEIWGTPIGPLQDSAYSGAGGEGYDLIGVQKAWDYLKGYGTGLLSPVQVGVVDSGLYAGNGQFDGGANISYTDPAAQLSGPEQITYSNGATGNDPAGGHGTGVNTLIGADADDGGPAGIASVLGSLLSISNTDLFAAPYGYGNKPTAPDPNDPSVVNWPDGNSYAYSDLAAIMAQVNTGSKVINLSWGPKDYKTVDKETAAVFKAFFERMAKEHPDVLFVAAAGNDGQEIDGEKYYPAGLNLPNMITVGNVTNDGQIWKESNTAGDNFEVTIFAPGEQSVHGYDPSSGTVTNTRGGTSMATPQVAATAALIKSINPSLDASQIKQIIQTSMRQNDWGEPILAVDEAVFNTINMNRELAGLPDITREELVKQGTINAVATPVPGSSNEYMVRAILESPNTPTVTVTITPSPGEVKDGETPRSVNGVGECAWLVGMDEAKGTITVYRKDNGAGSLITLGPQYDINGSWSGTVIISDIGFDAAAAGAGGESQGCDIMDKLKGVPFPMTIDISVDETGVGTAVVNMDVSSLNTDPEQGTYKAEPQTFNVRIAGNQVIFEFQAGSDYASTMTATVSGDGSSLTMEGTWTASGGGYKMAATWTASK